MDHLSQTLLSDRQKGCLFWLSQGKSSWEIGQILSISENTVNFHLKNAIRKLGTASRAEAVVKAMHLRLIEGGGGHLRGRSRLDASLDPRSRAPGLGATSRQPVLPALTSTCGARVAASPEGGQTS